MANSEERMRTIEDMITLLENFRRQKKEILPGAEFYDSIKAENYNAIIEWINSFAKKINIEMVATIRTEVPVIKVRFYQEARDDKIEKKFEFIVGAPDKLKIYDYYALSQGMFLDYKQNEKKVINGDYYDNILNVMGWIADNAVSIKASVQSVAERELFKKLVEEEKDLEKMIKLVKGK